MHFFQRFYCFYFLLIYDGFFGGFFQCFFDQIYQNTPLNTILILDLGGDRPSEYVYMYIIKS